jgi:hypothetical protein
MIAAAAAAIFVFASLALLQFFFWYCRSLIAATSGVELSESTREVARLDHHRVTGNDFQRLHQLVHLCPERGGDTMGLQFIRAYHAFLGLLQTAFLPLAPGWAGWMERERASCAYFTAVTLEARIARTRVLLAQQVSNQL